MDLVRQYLAEHGYFKGLPAAELEPIARLATLRTFSRGEVFALEGDPCRAVYFVVQGRVQAFKVSAQGREQVISELGAGQVLYLVPALDGGSLPANARAATRTTLLGFACRDWVAFLAGHPSVALRVLADMARRLRRLNALIEDLSLHSVSERLARLLLERACSAESHRMTQREMAAQLGTVREVLARALAQFERQGWIRVRRGVIEILDAEALQKAGVG